MTKPNASQEYKEEINKKFGLNVRVTKNIENLSTNFLGSEKEGKKKWLGIQ